LSGDDTRTVDVVGHGRRWADQDAGALLDELVSIA